MDGKHKLKTKRTLLYIKEAVQMEHTSFGWSLIIQNRFLNVWFTMLMRLITRKSHLSSIVTEMRTMWQF